MRNRNSVCCSSNFHYPAVYQCQYVVDVGIIGGINFLPNHFRMFPVIDEIVPNKLHYFVFIHGNARFVYRYDLFNL